MDTAPNQTPPPVESLPKTASQGLLGRFFGVLMSPRATFAGIAAKPRWFGILALIILVGIICSAAFMSTAVGRQAVIDQQDKMFDNMRSYGLNMPDAQREEAAQRILNMPTWRLVIWNAVGSLIGTPVIVLILAGLFYMVFTVFLNGQAKFRQVFTVVAHTGAVFTLQQVFITPLNYVRESVDSATNLYVLVAGFVNEGSFIAKFLGMIGLFWVWWILVLAIGLAVLYRRKTTPIAVSLFAVYGVIALAWAGVAAYLAARSAS